MIEAEFFGDGKLLCFKHKTQDALCLKYIYEHNLSKKIQERIHTLIEVAQTLMLSFESEVETHYKDLIQTQKLVEQHQTAHSSLWDIIEPVWMRELANKNVLSEKYDKELDKLQDECLSHNKV